MLVKRERERMYLALNFVSKTKVGELTDDFADLKLEVGEFFEVATFRETR